MTYGFYTGFQFLLMAAIFVGIWFLPCSWLIRLLFSGIFFLNVTFLLDIRYLLLNPEKAKKEFIS